MAEGGNVVEYHACEFFPQRWFDVVFVLRCSTEQLFDRLTARGYSERKVSENVECEIFGTILEEARGAYDADIVHELQSDTPDQCERNVDNIVAWVEQWRKDNGAISRETMK